MNGHGKSDSIGEIQGDYVSFIKDIKNQIRSAQVRAALSVNSGLIKLYWFIAERIVFKQKESAWGDGFLVRMSRDLQREFPDIKGFSTRNLKYMRQWYCFWQSAPAIGKQAVSQLPWGHNIVIVRKIKDLGEALFYVNKAIKNGWSRSVLMYQIESELYRREGKSVTDFEATLTPPLSDLAKEILKDPYNFDFLMLREEHDEKELEGALINHITKFLLELGAGFAYVGRQYKLEVGGEDFYIDLLFYHLKLRCFVVIELKKGKFKPEYAGKLNFYCNVVDDKIRTKEDQVTIGLILCQDKNELVAEYALRDINKPIGVSAYQLTKNLPKELQSSLPSIEELEAELLEDGLE